MLDKRAKTEPTLRADASEIEQAFFKHAKDLTAKVKHSRLRVMYRSVHRVLSMIVMSALSS